MDDTVIIMNRKFISKYNIIILGLNSKNLGLMLESLNILLNKCKSIAL